MNPSDRIHQAFLHLQFSIKLFRYFERSFVRKDEFEAQSR